MVLSTIWTGSAPFCATDRAKGKTERKMPNGVVKWFDPKSGDAEVVHSGRRYPARAHDIETVARRDGARVHFDIRREDGTDRAVDVRLREGTRVSHHQHRFGTLEGVRRADAKGIGSYATIRPELRSAAVHPLEVARAWGTCLAEGDVDGALALCAPDVVIHVDDGTIRGVRDVARWFESSAPFDSGRHARIRGEEDGTAVVTWSPDGQGGTGMLARCRIRHTQIAEMWASEPEPTSVLRIEQGGPPFTLAIVEKGDIDAKDRAEAEATVVRTVERLNEPVLFARLTLGWEPDPARTRPATAQVSLDLDGDLVRAHVAARSMPEAIDLLGHRIHDQLEHRQRRREQLHRSGALAQPGEWRHGDEPTHRPPYFDRPPDERQLVRHKMFAVGQLTPDEAVFDMNQLDYDFYLFCDLASGSDSLIERVEDGTYRLTQSSAFEEALKEDLNPTCVPIERSTTPVPTLALDEAIERLDAGHEPHVFFLDPTSGRGQVLYRRYDGHYGLITPD